VDGLVEKMALLFRVMPTANDRRAERNPTRPTKELARSVRPANIEEKDPLFQGYDAASQHSCVADNKQDHPELSSVGSVLQNRTVRPFFKLFLAAQFNTENLLFFDEVVRFKVIDRYFLLPSCLAGNSGICVGSPFSRGYRA